MARKRLLIFYLVDDFEVFHRTPMIRALARNAVGHFDVLCVSPPVSFASYFGRRRFGDFRPGKLDELGDNLFHFLPRIIEGRDLPRFIFRPDHYYKKFAEQIRRLPIFSGFWGDSINWIYRIEQRPIVEDSRGLPFVYECYDDYTRDLSSGREKRGSFEAERSLIRASLLTFTTSRELFRSRREISDSVVYAPNGADFSHFARKTHYVPPFDYPRPVIGYVGNISDFLDYSLIEETVRILPHFSFVFVGPVTSREAKRLRAYSNVHFEGFIERRDLPRYVSSFDAALIPFKVNEAMNAVNPLKLWEYLAAGKAVISTPIREMLKYGDVVYIASGGREYAEAVRRAASSKDRDRRERGLKIAEKHSWGSLTGKMLKTLMEALN